MPLQSLGALDVLFQGSRSCLSPRCHASCPRVRVRARGTLLTLLGFCSGPAGSEYDEEEVDYEESDSDESWTTESAISSEAILSSMCMNGGEEKPFACPVPGCKKRYKVKEIPSLGITRWKMASPVSVKSGERCFPLWSRLGVWLPSGQG